MEDVAGRFINSLVKKRERMALDLISTKVSREKYEEIFGRCLELQEIIDQARVVFKGGED